MFGPILKRSFTQMNLVLALAVAAPVLGDAPTTAPAVSPLRRAIGPDGGKPRVSVGIENVCAWPNLVMLKDGTIAALIFNQPSHGRLIGGIDCYTSADGGQTWARRATAAPPDEGAMHTRMNHAAGMARNGDLIVIAGGWTLRPEPNAHGPYQVDTLMRPYVSRSSDGGTTWTLNRLGFPETAPGGKTYVPFGSIAQASDGSLRVSAYVVGGQTFVLRSDDDGQTWKDPVQIQTPMKPNETTLWSDGKGRILAAARTRTLEVFESPDDGKTWTHLSRASEDLGIPGDLRQLADGRLLATHGNRQKGKEGVDVRVSSDGGKTWSVAARVADFIGYDGGYPSSVQRPDGKVVTAFYARKTADRDGYQMGVAIWDPVKTFDGIPAATFAPAAPVVGSDDPGAAPFNTTRHEVEVGDRKAPYLLAKPAVEVPAARRSLVVYLYGAGGSLTKNNLARDPYRSIRTALGAAGAYIVVPELGPQHFMNDDAQAVVTAVIERVTAEQGIDPARVHLMGTSMGGGSVLAYAVHHPQRVHSVVAIMPMTDFGEWAAESPKYAPRIAAAYGGTLAEKPQVYSANSALKQVDALAKIPVFLVHGDADKTVRAAHSQKLADAMKSKGYPYTLRIVPGAAHTDEVVLPVQDQIVEFLTATMSKPQASTLP